MWKAVVLFLIVMAVLAMFGKLGWLGRTVMPKTKIPRSRPCPDCGRIISDKQRCGCQTGKK
ncbi:hypothetical protein [Neogemmobacter tilapiae]|uniref:hypothetical protein n=1 Tax=Neogemmobacter tilapiae TaxID=875041 RepID=UPI0016760257|nr:hypothetical protein [Gemmobacter tilapiae]